MAFFSTQNSPIAIDFGSSSVKLLQIGSGDEPNMVAAAEVPIPDSVRLDRQKLMAFYQEHLPRTLSRGGFKSKRAVIGIPAGQTLTQHMQIARVDGASTEDLIKAQLNSQMGCMPDSIVVRSTEVCEVQRSGTTLTEMICFAMARDTVMQHINVLKKCKLNVVGVHTEAMSMLTAFDHLNRRDGDEQLTTLYIDLGWGGTQLSIGHGNALSFARHIQIGGRHFDQLIANTLHCDLATARTHRLGMQGTTTFSRTAAKANADHGDERGGTALLQAAAQAHAEATASTTEASTSTEERRTSSIPSSSCLAVPEGDGSIGTDQVDFSELIDTVTDEISMSLRYHRGLFPDRGIDRTIFVGGEARQVWLCQHIIRALRLSAQLGDPISRLKRDARLKTPGVKFDEPQPGWAVAMGLCTAPTDL